MLRIVLAVIGVVLIVGIYPLAGGGAPSIPTTS